MLEQIEREKISDFTKNFLPSAQAEIENFLLEINKNKKLVEDATTNFTTIQATAQSSSEAMGVKQKDLTEKSDALNTACSNLESVVEIVTQLKTDAVTAKQSVESDIKAIQTAKTSFDTLNTEAQDKAKELKDQQEEVQKFLTVAQGAHAKVIEYKEDLLDEKLDVNGNSIQSIRSQISTLHIGTQSKFDEITQYQLDVGTQFEKLEAGLKEKIEALLPGAGAAGLASTYHDAKGRYGMLPFRTEVKSLWLKTFYALWHYGVGGLRCSINHILFIAPIVGIVWLFVGILPDRNTLQRL